MDKQGTWQQYFTKLYWTSFDISTATPWNQLKESIILKVLSWAVPLLICFLFTGVAHCQDTQVCPAEQQSFYEFSLKPDSGNSFMTIAGPLEGEAILSNDNTSVQYHWTMLTSNQVKAFRMWLAKHNLTNKVTVFVETYQLQLHYDRLSVPRNDLTVTQAEKGFICRKLVQKCYLENRTGFGMQGEKAFYSEEECYRIITNLNHNSGYPYSACSCRFE